jgi:hypothetical protein
LGCGGWTLGILCGLRKRRGVGRSGLSRFLGISWSMRRGWCLLIRGWGRILRWMLTIGLGGLGLVRRLGGSGCGSMRFGTW